jgi:hypothetical protein
MDWLQSLTPAVESDMAGRTTLASIIEQTKSLYAANGDSKTDRFITISSMVASLVVDGLSRIGYGENHENELDVQQSCVGEDSSCPWHWGRNERSEIWDAILRNKAQLQPDDAHRRESGRDYTWYATVAGYGMKASSTAYYLAFAVLYIYLFLVLFHVAYVVCKGHAGHSWSSLTDLLVLCRTSPAPQHVLKNTSAGVRARSTMKLETRVRVNDAVPFGEERLQLLIGQHGTATSLSKAAPDKEYGAQN